MNDENFVKEKEDYDYDNYFVNETLASNYEAR
jgi:hypothetical protein